MFKTSQFLAAIQRPHLLITTESLSIFRPRCAHFACAGHRRPKEHQQRISGARCFADDEDSSVTNPLHSLRCLTTLIPPAASCFRHGRRWAEDSLKHQSRAEKCADMPCFAMN